MVPIDAGDKTTRAGYSKNLLSILFQPQIAQNRWYYSLTFNIYVRYYLVLKHDEILIGEQIRDNILIPLNEIYRLVLFPVLRDEF